MPRLSTAFRALLEKFRDDNVSDKFFTLGLMLTIIKVFELPPTERIRFYFYFLKSNSWLRMNIKSRELFTRPKNKDTKSLVAQKHCLGSFMSKTRVQVPPPPLIVTIESSKKNNDNSIKDH